MELRMSGKERDRIEVMRRLGRGEIRQVDAAKALALSTRQVRRITRRVERDGDRGLIHRARGRPSNRRIPPDVERRARALLREKYHDFGPTLAAEHLAEDDAIALSRETVRRLMGQEHLWANQRKPRPHRRRRERRAAFGELVQIDTSEHDWFEGRGPKARLITLIDDATGRRVSRLFEADTTVANLEMIRRWLEHHGRPRALYADAASHFRPPRQAGKRRPKTQIERALETLGIGLIIARSPQAKGRVERNHGVDQDRLIKQMRLREISDIAEANRFLDEEYLPRMNDRFAVAARHRRDAHRSVRRFDLDAILCPHETRRVANDHSVSLDSVLWQISPNGRSLAGEKISVERRLDGSVRLRHGTRYLDFGLACRQRGRAWVGPRSGRRPSLAPTGHGTTLQRRQ